MADERRPGDASPESGLTRRELLRRQAAAGAGYVAAGALLGGPLADGAGASSGPTVHSELYPLPGFRPDIDLRGKTAVITGASSGIGRATGKALAAHGVRVIGTSRDVASVPRKPGFSLLDVDITKTASIDAFMKRLRRKLGASGRVDILINNAGRGIVGGVLPPAGGEERYLAQLQLGHRTDHTGHLAMTHRMLPLLPASGYARVCFTVSISAYTVATGALTDLHGYVAMKRGLLASANAWRATLEQAHSNIAVTTMNPYFVNTRFPDNLILTERAPAGSPTAAYVEAMRRAFALGLPPSLVAQAYWQVLSSSRPPANVAAGSATEPLASRGGNRLTETEILAENAQAAVRFD